MMVVVAGREGIYLGRCDGDHGLKRDLNLR